MTSKTGRAILLHDVLNEAGPHASSCHNLVFDRTKHKLSSVIGHSVKPFAEKNMTPLSWVMVTWDNASFHRGCIFSSHLQLNLQSTSGYSCCDLRCPKKISTKGHKEFFFFLAIISDYKQFFPVCYFRVFEKSVSIDCSISSSAPRYRLPTNPLWFRWGGWLIRHIHTCSMRDGSIFFRYGFLL